jgi:hypothetical protein
MALVKQLAAALAAAINRPSDKDGPVSADGAGPSILHIRIPNRE